MSRKIYFGVALLLLVILISTSCSAPQSHTVIRKKVEIATESTTYPQGLSPEENISITSSKLETKTPVSTTTPKINSGATLAPAVMDIASTPAPVIPSITVEDQHINQGTIYAPIVVADAEEWLVIHRQDKGGLVGAAVGYTKVKPGINRNVPVKVDISLTSSILIAMLHEDKGKIGVLEYPGPDQPVMYNNQMVASSFSILSISNGDALVTLSKSPDTISHLVDIRGMSLYVSLLDKPGQDNCAGDCLKIWRPELVIGRLVAGYGISQGDLGTITLLNGLHQVTYRGAPLYTYRYDLNPEDTSGNSIDEVWYIALP